jgi:hypothetical protein
VIEPQRGSSQYFLRSRLLRQLSTMQQDTPKDTTARMPPPQFSTANFDCELPTEARAELLTTYRRRYVSELTSGRRRPLMQRLARSAASLALFLAVPVALITAAIMTFSELSRQSSTARQVVSPTLPAAQTPVVQPLAIPAQPQLYREWVP